MVVVMVCSGGSGALPHCLVTVQGGHTTGPPHTTEPSSTIAARAPGNLEIKSGETSHIPYLLLSQRKYADYELIENRERELIYFLL